MRLIKAELQVHKICNPCTIVTAKEGGYTRWRSSLRHCATSRVRFPMVSLEFFIELLLSASLWSCSQSGL